MFYIIKETNFLKKYCFRGRSHGIPPSVKGRGSQRQTGGWIGMRRVNDGRRTSRRLRTTVSAHHVVPPTLPHFLICLSLLVFLALFGFLLLVPHVFFSLFCCYFSPLPLSTPYVPFSTLSHLYSPLFVSTAVSVQCCTCPFKTKKKVIFSVFELLRIQSNVTQKCKVITRKVLQELPTLVVSSHVWHVCRCVWQNCSGLDFELWSLSVLSHLNLFASSYRLPRVSLSLRNLLKVCWLCGLTLCFFARFTSR